MSMSRVHELFLKNDLISKLIPSVVAGCKRFTLWLVAVPK
jgi:hypothetical protein